MKILWSALLHTATIIKYHANHVYHLLVCHGVFLNAAKILTILAML